MTISKHKRYWAVWDRDGTLVCLTVYKQGAEEVVRRLEAALSYIAHITAPSQDSGGTDARP